MAAALKFTFLMNSASGSGWSESYYTNSYSTLDQLNVVMPTYAGARRQILAQSASIVGWRLTSTDPLAARQSIVNTSIFTGGYPGVNATDAQAEGAAWLASLKAANGAGHRQLWMRGLPLYWTRKNPTFQLPTPDPTFFIAWTNWLLFIKSNNFCIRIITSLKATPAINKTPISVLAPGAGTGLATLTPVTIGNLDSSMPITVSGFRAPLSYLNGTYLPNVSYTPGVNTITLTHKPCSTGQATAYNGGAWARTTVYTYTNIATGLLIDSRWRETGRDFFVRRGRRSK